MALTQTQVSELYVAIFNRASEGNGNAYWISTGFDSNTMVSEMLATADAQTYFGSSLDTNQAFVEHIYLNTLNKTVADDAAGIAYWVALLDAGHSKGEVVAGLVAAINNPENAGAAQDQFNNRVAVSNYTANTLAAAPADYATSLGFGADLAVTNDAATVVSAFTAVDALVTTPVDPGTTPTEGTTQLLTLGQDNLTGTAGDDTFNGFIFDNSNSAQSGDMIDGAAGTDSLFADIGNSQNFAITLHTTSVENFAVRAQADSTDSGENNTNGIVQIDAERMNGTDRYESNNSRADVIIEDVRIEDTQITQDITIAMVQADAGDIDMGVYFDIASLRAQGDVTSGAGLDLNLMDVESATAGLDPLLNNPYDVVTFSIDGVAYSLTLKGISDVNTYVELQAALNLALSANPALSEVTAEIVAGHTFTGINSNDATTATGTSITLVNAGSGVFATGGWSISGSIPASGEYLNDQAVTDPSSSSSLITSTIILDDVGRGSNGGDLVVGAMSTGATSNSTGVQQFNIFVDRNSKLGTINSTNNTLQEVFIVNADNTSDSNTTATGNLTVNGNNAGGNELPGDDAQDNAFGFSDVRVLDASAMVGSVNFTAELTSAVTTKYMNLVDVNGDPAADNIDFLYSLGTNNDTLALTISAANLSAAGTTAREDFTLLVDGGTGNDTITTAIDAASDGTNAWYLNSKLNANLSINGGAGNDTVTVSGAGDFVVVTGAGDDTVYVDNSGVQNGLVAAVATGDRGTWVLNTASQLLLAGDAAEVLGNLVSSSNASHNLYRADVTVTFKGLTATAVIASSATTYKATDLQINNAIKAAISADDVLNKLIVATDGPANTLVITSLVDGAQVEADLGVAITASATAYTAAEVTAINTAWGTAYADSAAAVIGMNAVAAAITGTDADAYMPVFAETDAAAAVIAGVNSTNVNDSTITAGTGDDVIVLSTTGDGIGADGDNLTVATDMLGSNNTVVYDAAFGNDTIVNFTADLDVTAAQISLGADVLNFRALLGTTATTLGAVGSTDSVVTIAAFQNTNADAVIDAGDNFSADAVKALFNAANADDAVANKNIYIAYTAANIGSVYQVVDAGTAALEATDVTVTLLGTIDLADTAWNTITADNLA